MSEPVALGDVSAQAPYLVLGGKRSTSFPDSVLKADSCSLFSPRGACLHPVDNRLWVADSGHHRLLGWQQLQADQQAAEICLGQQSFQQESMPEAASAYRFRLPVGVCPLGQGLALADSWHHRVLIWLQRPDSLKQMPDVILGQADASGMDANRGRALPAADSLHTPSGVHWDGEHLFVADTLNRRVLIWNGLPHTPGQAADRVLGQQDFHCRDENAGQAASAMSFRWPHAITSWNGRLCVADAGNHRILIFAAGVPASGAAATVVLGQGDFAQVMPNRAALQSNSCSLNMPYGVSACGDTLAVADTGNSRVLLWRYQDIDNGSPAAGLIGQEDFQQLGENRWGKVSENSLCWPYAVQLMPDRILITDTGNHRVSLWSMAGRV